MKKKIFGGFGGLLVLFCIWLYIFTGFFVIQPIGAIPDGTTVWFWRNNTNLSFISSADSILLDSTGEVTLLGRMIVLGKIGDLLADKKITTFSYIDSFYLISTKGKRFEK